MEFNYETAIIQKKYNVSFFEKEAINLVFQNIITDISSSVKYKTFGHYLRTAGLSSDSHLWTILTDIVSYYVDVKDFELNDEWKEKLLIILKNKYIKLEMVLSAKMTYMPELNEYTLYWKDKKIILNSPNELEGIFSNSVELKSFDEIDEIEKTTDIKVDVDFKTRTCYIGDTKQDETIFKNVLEQNIPEFKIEGAKELNNLDDELQLVGPKFYRKNINKNNISIGNGFVNVNMMKDVLEYIRIYKLHGYYFYDKKIVSQKKLVDSTIYSQILDNINSLSEIKYVSWIIRECVKNQDLTPEAINNILSVNKSITKDKETCRIILLSDNLNPNSIEMDKYDFESSVEKYPAQRLEYAFTRLKKSSRDAISNMKLLTRLYSNGFETSLSNKQRSSVEDLVLKTKAMDDEHTELIGQIVKSGIREKMKSMSNDIKKEYGFNKPFRRWLNSNQGHNEGNVINEDQLNKTRSIWKKIYKWQKEVNDI